MRTFSKKSIVYAYGFFNSLDRKSLEKVSDDFLDFVNLLKSNNKILCFFKSPKFSKKEKLGLLNKALKNKKLLKFLSLIVTKNAMEEIFKIYEMFNKIKIIKKGFLPTKISVSEKMQTNGKNILIRKIEKISSQKIAPDFLVDENLVDGFSALLDNKIQINYSLKRDFEELKEKFLEVDHA